MSAVWTGSEMIIWGGYGGGYVNTGARYNPATDIWTPMATANAPAGRDGHTAVWTGAEMIVWGGYDDDLGIFYNTGGRYNPTTNAWQATNLTGAPSARSNHSAVWAGNEMIVWGGITGGGTSTGGHNPAITPDSEHNRAEPAPF
jgi:N-acetylneuraminic acid mutarotase